MSVIQIHGVHDGDVLFSDGLGEARIPVHLVDGLAYTAVQRDSSVATHEGRRYDRDDLLALKSFLAELERCDNRTATWRCEERGTEDMGNGLRFCAGCCSSASGAHDDRMEAV